jgi:hypothetical protein
MSHYFRRIDRMLQQHRMPAEYDDFYSIILCNDCEQKSKTKYHFLYHKCQHCQSYNTKILQTIQERMDSASNGIVTLGVDVAASEANGSIRPRSSSAVSSESRQMVPDDNEGRNRPT